MNKKTKIGVWIITIVVLIGSIMGINFILHQNTIQTQTPIPENFSTYKNSQFNFKIDYPSDWIIDNNVQGSICKDCLVAFKNNPSYPDAIFMIREDHNNGNTFSVFLSQYKAQLAQDNPVEITSEKKVTIGNFNAYQLEYVTSIGNSKCFNRDYIIDSNSSIPILNWGRCDQGEFVKYMPIFERMVSSFSPLQ